MLFKSGRPGSGNDMTYTITLPKDPKKQPNASGKGGTTWNFQLRPTFWFGLTMCDTSPPPSTPRHARRTPTATTWWAPIPPRQIIGKHPGNAYMELQFYGPGYVPQFEGFAAPRISTARR